MLKELSFFLTTTARKRDKEGRSQPAYVRRRTDHISTQKMRDVSSARSWRGKKGEEKDMQEGEFKAPKNGLSSFLLAEREEKVLLILFSVWGE